MFLDTIKEFVRRIMGMFNKGTIEQTTNVDVAISNLMVNAIELWSYIYENKAPWVDKKKVFSMNLGVGIASEFAKLVTIEFKSQISNNDFLNTEYQKLVNNIRIRTIVEKAAAKGGIVFKPYISSNGHIPVDVIEADSFYPTAFDSNGEVTGAIFPTTKVVGNDTYTRIEYHNFQDGEYTIINKAYKKKNYNSINISMDTTLGTEISLANVQEWAELTPIITFQNVERPLFAYFKMPLANRIDQTSPLGVSIYDRIADQDGGLLRKIDEMYSNVLWEYEAKQAAVFASRDLFKKPDDYINRDHLEDRSDRLYKVLDIDSNSSEAKAIDVFSPEIRDTSLFNGLNKLLQQAEFLIGLAKGTLSDVIDTDKTATEVKMSKQRSFQTVKDIQNNLSEALGATVYAMSYYGQVAKLPVSQVNTDKDISYDFDDSILIDRETELKDMQTDVSLGIIDKVYYIMEKYKKTEAEAKAMIPKETIIKPDPFANVK